MWLSLAFLSACLLGCYDIFKKKSVRENAVIPVLLFNTIFSSIIFLPFLILSRSSVLNPNDFLYVGTTDLKTQGYIFIKSAIVLLSWFFAYIGVKHLPLSLVGPMQATRPVLVLLGAILVFSEQLNCLQWIGVIIAIISLYLLSRSGKKEGISFVHNRWIYCVGAGIFFGACAGLYDKFLMSPTHGLGLDRMAVQTYYNFYQTLLMALALLALWLPKRASQPFHWTWCIFGISVFLSLADFVYLYALSLDGALISVVSMIRRGSVLVSFLFAAIILKEKNLRAKAFDLALVFLSMIFLYLGSR